MADSILLLLSYRCFFPSHTRNVLHQPHLADSISTGVLCVLVPLSRCCSSIQTSLQLHGGNIHTFKRKQLERAVVMKSREKEAMLRVGPGRQQQQKRTVGIFRWLFPQRKHVIYWKILGIRDRVRLKFHVLNKELCVRLTTSNVIKRSLWVLLLWQSWKSTQHSIRGWLRSDVVYTCACILYYSLYVLLHLCLLVFSCCSRI